MNGRSLNSVVCDLPKLRIYLYFDRQFDTPYNIDIKTELAKTTEVYRKIALEDMVFNRGNGKKN